MLDFLANFEFDHKSQIPTWRWKHPNRKCTLFIKKEFGEFYYSIEIPDKGRGIFWRYDHWSIPIILKEIDFVNS